MAYVGTGTVSPTRSTADNRRENLRDVKRPAGLPHPDGGDRLLVVYADGYTTAMSKHDVADETRGDDFCEPLPLLDLQSDGATLHAQLTDGVAAGLDLFVITLDRTSTQFFPADSQEATR